MPVTTAVFTCTCTLNDVKLQSCWSNGGKLFQTGSTGHLVQYKRKHNGQVLSCMSGCSIETGICWLKLLSTELQSLFCPSYSKGSKKH